MFMTTARSTLASIVLSSVAAAALEGHTADDGDGDRRELESRRLPGFG